MVSIHTAIENSIVLLVENCPKHILRLISSSMTMSLENKMVGNFS